MNPKRFVIAGTFSGCGKTTVTLGIIAALKKRGLCVASFKIGPDFIDPGHHRRMTGRTSHNLDGWMLTRDYNMKLFEACSTACDVSIIEGAMGLFDGFDGKSERGSTAEMAKWLGARVILVVSARSMARSAAALIKGFESFDPDLSFAGIILNHVGSSNHLQTLKESIKNVTGIPILGALHRDETICIPERHLGLFTDEVLPISSEKEEALADMIEKGVDLSFFPDAVVRKKDTNGSSLIFPERPSRTSSMSKQPRIGVARDAAFSFYYEENIRLLEDAGAKIVYFSPLESTELPADIHGLYFGGGYPELFAQTLSGNDSLLADIKTASRDHMPIWGECGGFIYLCATLCMNDRTRYPMAGCFPFEISMQPRLFALGYRRVVLTKDILLGKKGDVIKGHEFHYSRISERDHLFNTSFKIEDRSGIRRNEEGYLVHNTLGSYLHLHLGSYPEAASHFVSSCRTYQKGKGIS